SKCRTAGERCPYLVRRLGVKPTQGRLARSLATLRSRACVGPPGGGDALMAYQVNLKNHGIGTAFDVRFGVELAGAHYPPLPLSRTLSGEHDRLSRLAVACPKPGTSRSACQQLPS